MVISKTSGMVKPRVFLRTSNGSLTKLASGNDKSSGTVTAEFAVVVPAILLLLTVVVSFFSLAVDQLRLNDVAYMSAHAVIRGERLSVIERRASEVMGRDITLETIEESEIVMVRISSRSKVLPLSWLSLRVQATQKVIY